MMPLQGLANLDQAARRPWNGNTIRLLIIKVKIFSDHNSNVRPLTGSKRRVVRLFSVRSSRNLYGPGIRPKMRRGRAKWRHVKRPNLRETSAHRVCGKVQPSPLATGRTLADQQWNAAIFFFAVDYTKERMRNSN